MSVINRMLADLERRGAPATESGEPDMRPAAPRRRPRRLPAGVGAALLAVALVAVAGALWWQRGDRILAAFTPDAAPAPPKVAEIVGVVFDRRDGRPRFALQVSGELERQPRYSRSGDRATLVVDAASPDVLLPAPPARSVFRGIFLDTDPGAPTRVRLDLDESVELDLVVGERTVALLGPVTPLAEQEPPDVVQTPATASAAGGADALAAGGSMEIAAPELQPEGAGQEVAATRSPPAREMAEPAPEAGDAGERSGVDGDQAASTDATVAAREGSGDELDTGEPPTVAAEPGDAERAAEGTVRKSRSTSPETRARRRHREGRDAIGRGELAVARGALREALELDPALHPARDLLVALLRRSGDSAAARRLLAQGVELAPARAEYAMPYARLLVDIGELDRAAAVLGRARANGAGSAGYHALMAALQQRRGEHRVAVSEYTRALEIRTGNGLWWLGLGVSLAALEKPAEARAAFREARASGTLSESLDRWVQRRIENLATGNGG